MLREWLPALETPLPSPPITLSLWDHDELPTDPDDFIGTCSVPLEVLAPGEPLQEPTWRALASQGVEGGASGEVLVLLQVWPLASCRESHTLTLTDHPHPHLHPHLHPPPPSCRSCPFPSRASYLIRA